MSNCGGRSESVRRGNGLSAWCGCGGTAAVGAVVVAAALAQAGFAAADGGQPLQLAAFTMQAESRTAEAGMLERISRWFDKSVTDFNDGIKGAFGGLGRAGEHTREAARSATTGVGGSAGSLTLGDMHIIDKRQACPTAGNGAPDCTRAAIMVCRSKGFTNGRSFETRSEAKCSAAALLARHAGHPTVCRNETFVLRSLCQ
jgi:hypothetical protein